MNIEDDADDDEEESDDDDDDDDEDFDDEPAKKIGSTVEEYGVESGLPGDEEGSEGELREERGPGRFDHLLGDDPQRTKKIAAVLCCIVVALVILGIILGVALGGGDDPAPAPTGPPPTPVPVPTDAPIAPDTPSPTVATPAPTLGPLPEEIIVEPLADTYIFVGPDAERGPFGDSSIVIVQNAVEQAAAIGLFQFNISGIPDPGRIEELPSTAFMIVQVDDPTSLPGTVTVDTMRFRSTGIDLENLPSFSDPDAFDKFTTVPGPSFEVTPTTLEVEIEVTDLIFEQAPFLRGRRRKLTTQRDQFFIGFMVQSTAASEGVSFSSRESDVPPRLEIRIEVPEMTATPSITPGPTMAPSLSPAPSTSTMPSLSAAPSTPVPTTSPAPSLSESPTVSLAPSIAPSLSYNPTAEPYFCAICGDGNNITNPEGPLNLPIIGQTTCASLQGLGDWGSITKENCDFLLPVVDPICCAELFVCPICMDGSDISNPDGEVLGGDTCATLVTRASVGLIDETDCPALQETVEEVCCDTIEI